MSFTDTIKRCSRNDVDLPTMLDRLEAKAPEPRNWRTSVIDLMKDLGVDSSFDNRIRLARELGYTEIVVPGDNDSTAAMNNFLHSRMMGELGRHGGKIVVPPDWNP